MASLLSMLCPPPPWRGTLENTALKTEDYGFISFIRTLMPTLVNMYLSYSKQTPDVACPEVVK
jgi:hypothetical protein